MEDSGTSSWERYAVVITCLVGRNDKHGGPCLLRELHKAHWFSEGDGCEQQRLGVKLLQAYRPLLLKNVSPEPYYKEVRGNITLSG